MDFTSEFDEILKAIDKKNGSVPEPEIPDLGLDQVPFNKRPTINSDELEIEMPEEITPTTPFKFTPSPQTAMPSIEQSGPKIPNITTSDKPVLAEIVDIPLANRFAKEEKKSEPKKKKANIEDIRAKSVGEVVIPKLAKAVNFAAEVFEEKKGTIKKIIATIVATYMLGAAIPNAIIEESYQNKIGVGANEFIEYDIYDEVLPTQVEEIGENITEAIKKEMEEFDGLHLDDGQKYDVNKAILVYLGTAYDHIVHTGPYTKKGTINESWGAGERNDKWLVRLYGAMRDSLAEAGIIELPETIEEYLKANGLHQAHYKYNPATNKLKSDDKKGEVGFMDSLDNLAEMARFLQGHGINPAKQIHNKLFKIIEQLQDAYPQMIVKLDEGKIKLYDLAGNEVYEVIKYEPMIVLMEIPQRNLEEGVTNARS